MNNILERPVRSAAIFLGGPALAILLSALPAFAASHQVGVSSSCVVVNPKRFQCNFPTLVGARTLELQYASMQCGSTGNAFSLQEIQVLTTPPNSASEVAYQIPITNQPSLGGVVSAGSPVKLYAKAGNQPRALIDLTPAPTGSTQCTLSLSGEFGAE
jgi:hypothetical protein